MSFSTSQFSRDIRIFSHDYPQLANFQMALSCSLTASSLTQTVEAMFAKVHKLLLVKSNLSSSMSWNFYSWSALKILHSMFLKDLRRKQLSNHDSTDQLSLQVPLLQPRIRCS